MMTQIAAYLASAALLAFAIAMLLAGRSLWLVARAVIGWSAAVLSIVLTFAAFGLVAFRCLTDHAPAAPVSGILAIGGALVIIGLAAKATGYRSPTSHTATLAPCVASKRTATPAPHMTGAARDAIAALISLGYTKRQAASAVAAVAASLDLQADTSALVKAALRARVRQ
jgi:thiol:disulfide interchange protein